MYVSIMIQHVSSINSSSIFHILIDLRVYVYIQIQMQIQYIIHTCLSMQPVGSAELSNGQLIVYPSFTLAMFEFCGVVKPSET